MADIKELWNAWQDSFGICTCIGICGTTHRCNAVDASFIYRLGTEPSKFVVARPGAALPNFDEYDAVEFTRLKIARIDGELRVLCGFCYKGAKAIETEKKAAEAKEIARLSKQDGLPFRGT